MANFKEAIKKILANEGGYSNNPNDAGGETFMGISRKYHPDAKFWDIVDEIKSKFSKIKTIDRELKNNKSVTDEIESIYKSKYWDSLNLDEVANDRFAKQIFDSAVNIGVGATTKILEKILNGKK